MPDPHFYSQRLQLVRDRLTFSHAGSQLARRWAGTLVIIAVCEFAYFTLFPFNFSLHTGQIFDRRIFDPSDLFDWVMNTVLSFPLGFALGAVAAGRGWMGGKAWKMFLLAGVGCCLFSTCVECLQLMLPGRVSAIADILSNTAGGLVGCLVYFIVGHDFLRVVDRLARLARRSVVGLPALAALLVVIALICAVPAYLLRRPRLATWNANFPLLVGNENNTGDDGSRQWTGTLTALHIADRAADPQTQVPRLLDRADFASVMGTSVIADYSLKGPGPYVDATHQQPDLAWHWQSPRIAPGAAARFSYQNFLQTAVPVTHLIKAISATDSFTICFCCAAEALDQTGPARLLSCSETIYSRDLTIGQDGSDLVLRLRVRGASGNGMLPEWHVPHFFRDTAEHLLLITYDGDILRVYQDSPTHLWRVRTPPEYAILGPILARPSLSMSINGTGALLYVGLFYFLADLPISVVLGLILSRAVIPSSVAEHPPLILRLILPILGMLLAVTALYVTVDRLGVRAIGWTEFPLSALLLAIQTAIFGHWWHRGPAHPRPEGPVARVISVGYAR